MIRLLISMADSDSESGSEGSFGTPSYNCGCYKLAEWDVHPKCCKHMGDGHARRLIAGINEPECRFCYVMGIELRRQWVGDYVLMKNAVVRSIHSTVASLPSTSHAVGGSTSVVWPDPRPTASEASWQPAELASANEAVARWAHQAQANRAVSRAGSTSSDRGDRAVRSRVAPIGSRPNVLGPIPSLNPVAGHYGGHLEFVPPADPKPQRARVAAKADREASSAESDATFPREVKRAKRTRLEVHEVEGAARSVAPTTSFLPRPVRVAASRVASTPPGSISPDNRVEDLVDGEDMEVVESVEKEAKGPSSKELQRLIALLPRALKSAHIEEKTEPELSATAKDFPSVDKTGSRVYECPTLPKAMEVLCHAGKDPSTAKTVNASGVHYSMRVQGLHRKVSPPREPERTFLECSPTTATLKNLHPTVPNPMGREVDEQAKLIWNASLRTAGLASTIGILAYHLKALVSVDENMAERHRMALAAIDASEFHNTFATAPGKLFAREVMEVADHMFYLAMDVCRECSTSSVAATLQRRSLWLNAMGITVKTHVEPWMNVPVTPSSPGLFDATPARLEEFKKQQENVVALQKELKVPKTAAATAPVQQKGKNNPQGQKPRNDTWDNQAGRRKSNRGRKNAKGGDQSKQRDAKTSDAAKKA